MSFFLLYKALPIVRNVFSFLLVGSHIWLTLVWAGGVLEILQDISAPSPDFLPMSKKPLMFCGHVIPHTEGRKRKSVKETVASHCGELRDKRTRWEEVVVEGRVHKPC